MSAFPIYGKLAVPPGAHDALMANDEVTVLDDDTANDAVVAKDAVDGVNVILVAALAVVANELDTALFAQLLVPKKLTPVPTAVYLDAVTEPPK